MAGEAALLDLRECVLENAEFVGEVALLGLLDISVLDITDISVPEGKESAGEAALLDLKEYAGDTGSLFLFTRGSVSK